MAFRIKWLDGSEDTVVDATRYQDAAGGWIEFIRVEATSGGPRNVQVLRVREGTIDRIEHEP